MMIDLVLTVIEGSGALTDCEGPILHGFQH